MMDVLIATLDPFVPQSDYFGHHLFDAIWKYDGRLTSTLETASEIPCSGALIIRASDQTQNVGLFCEKCGQKAFTRRSRIEFDAYWALTTLQVWLDIVSRLNRTIDMRRYRDMGDKSGDKCPMDVMFQDHKLYEYSPALVWSSWFEPGKHLASPRTDQEPPCGWAAIELVNLMRAIHASTLKNISESTEKAIGEAHSAFGWLYQK